MKGIRYQVTLSLKVDKMLSVLSTLDGIKKSAIIEMAVSNFYRERFGDDEETKKIIEELTK